MRDKISERLNRSNRLRDERSERLNMNKILNRLRDEESDEEESDDESNMIKVEIESSEDSEVTRKSQFHKRPKVTSGMVSSKIRDMGLNTSRYDINLE